MSSNNQEKMTKYLDFPFDTFLMLRFEYSIVFDDEMVVKVLRIIEYYLELERKKIYREVVNRDGIPSEPLDITRDVWVPISYKLFMSDLYGRVNSENTIKRALKLLMDCRVVLRRHEPKKRYDAPEYTINHAALQLLLNLTRGYQKLIPSVLDTLKNSPPQPLTPSEYQKLIPSEIDLSVKSKSRVSEVDTNFNNSNNNGTKHKSITASSTNVPDATPPLSEILQRLEALEQENASLKAQLSQQHPPVEQTPPQEPTPSVEPAPNADKANTNHIANGTTSESEEEAPAQPPTGEIPSAVQSDNPKGKGGRKPRVPKEKKLKRTEEEEKRIDTVFDCLDKVAQEALAKEMGGEPSDFTFSRPETDRAHIHDLLQGRTVSPKSIHMVFMELWNRPKGQNGFEWKRNMSVAAICRNFDNALLSALGKSGENAQSTGSPKKLIAATPGSQYIVDAIVDFEETEFRAWQQARDAEAAAQYAQVGG